MGVWGGLSISSGQAPRQCRNSFSSSENRQLLGRRTA
jgi:hypothetical protein